MFGKFGKWVKKNVTTVLLGAGTAVLATVVAGTAITRAVFPYVLESVEPVLHTVSRVMVRALNPIALILTAGALIGLVISKKDDNKIENKVEVAKPVVEKDDKKEKALADQIKAAELHAKNVAAAAEKIRAESEKLRQKMEEQNQQLQQQLATQKQLLEQQRQQANEFQQQSNQRLDILQQQQNQQSQHNQQMLAIEKEREKRDQLLQARLQQLQDQLNACREQSILIRKDIAESEREVTNSQTAILNRLGVTESTVKPRVDSNVAVASQNKADAPQIVRVASNDDDGPGVAASATATSAFSLKN